MKESISNPAVTSSSICIQTDRIAKRFNREWIIRNFTYSFQTSERYVITGPNGSGKSTVLQLLWGQLPQTSGTIRYQLGNSLVPIEEVYQHVSIAAPYMDLIEELTLEEHIRFHFQLRKMRPGFSIDSIINNLYLNEAKSKAVANFSSGMRQRLKLGLAFFTDSKALFLDEPGTNLDARALQWYHQNLKEQPPERLIIVASNQQNEYPESATLIDITRFKTY